MDGVPKLTVKELKKRYTALSVEEKAALVQRNRENRERKNSASISGTGSQTVNCQPSFQPVPSSTPMSSSTPGVQSNCVFQEVFISGRFVINIVKQESIVSGQRITGAPRTQGTVYSQSVPPIKLASIPLLRYKVRNSMFKEPVLHDAIKIGVRNSMFKEPVLHDAIKIGIGVNFRNQELLQPAEQNNAPRKSEVVIVEDNEVCERNMASSGAGRDESRAIVEELVGFGSTVHTCARSEAELSRCQEELTAKGLAVSFSVCDVSVRTDREELVSRVRELFGGKLNILVNNAGLTLSKLTLETTTSDYTQQIVANFESCFHLSQLLHPLLKAFERGSIINISSISSYLAYPYLAVYSAAKGAMNQFSKALASDWAGDNIRINCVAPGLTRTPLLEEHPTPSVKET
uniref:Uncharacterized protein n=1 Tax=Oryza rufipogon TaxID=4529 RepID=A0A0E0R7U6_ORYRU